MHHTELLSLPALVLHRFFVSIHRTYTWNFTLTSAGTCRTCAWSSEFQIFCYVISYTSTNMSLYSIDCMSPICHLPFKGRWQFFFLSSSFFFTCVPRRLRLCCENRNCDVPKYCHCAANEMKLPHCTKKLLFSLVAFQQLGSQLSLTQCSPQRLHRLCLCTCGRSQSLTLLFSS